MSISFKEYPIGERFIGFTCFGFKGLIRGFTIGLDLWRYYFGIQIIR